MASRGEVGDGQAAGSEATQRLLDAATESTGSSSLPTGANTADIAQSPASPDSNAANEDELLPEPAPTQPPATPAPPSDPIRRRTELRADLTASQLIEFLGIADRDMQDIWSRLPQIEGGRDELIRLAKMKLEASRRLQQHADADDKSKSIGARGELQALSHLASFNDLQAAQELEDLAAANLQSNDPDLASDSRLVLIGFALEALQSGEAGAAERVIGYIDQIAASNSVRDVPTLMVMGQARDALAAYGHQEHAARVRDTIVELYADSPNPDLAMAAAELAGNAVFDKLESLLSQILSGQPVTADQWQAAVTQALQDAPNLRTVEYLASSALQFEAIGKEDLVNATFDTMTSSFDDPNTELGREVRIAVAAKDARRDILGVRFNPALPSVDGGSLSMDAFEGRVVLVPFWAAAFPESLQLVGVLDELRKAHPDDVAIVGVNLDGNDALLQEFLDQNELGFPSFRSKSSAEAEVANPIAAQFGIASMPFLAIVDQQGQVAALNFTGQGIQEKVNELLTQP